MLIVITLLFQIRVVADDQGRPPRSSTATVTVRVRRDQYPPQFDNHGSYDRTIDVTSSQNGTTVTVVRCSDRDLQVSATAVILYSVILYSVTEKKQSYIISLKHGRADFKTTLAFCLNRLFIMNQSLCHSVRYHVTLILIITAIIKLMSNVN